MYPVADCFGYLASLAENIFYHHCKFNVFISWNELVKIMFKNVYWLDTDKLDFAKKIDMGKKNRQYIDI